MTRAIIIGDIHGCLNEFERLLDKLNYDPNVDQVFLVGDLVGKGPDSLGVIEKAIAVNAISVRGNHDDILIRHYQKYHLNDETVVPSPLNEEYLKIAGELKKEHWDYLLAMPLYYRIPQHNVLLVHAGVIPTSPMESQEANLLMNIRNILEDGTGTSAQNIGKPWIDHWEGPEILVFGHDAVRGLQLKRKQNEEQTILAIGLDTGACYGRQLSAVVFPGATVVQEQAAKVYCEPTIPLQAGDASLVQVVEVPVTEPELKELLSC